jgi:hypothetical protein
MSFGTEPSNSGFQPLRGPDGGALSPHIVGAENGISDVNAPISSLIGVFLDAGQPDLSVAPGALDFSTIGLDFTVLSPELKQVFFIGDGLTSTGVTQSFVAPSGATRLFLGTMDGGEWSNNPGSLSVELDASAVPEPGSLLLVSMVFCGIAIRYRGRRSPARQ